MGKGLRKLSTGFFFFFGKLSSNSLMSQVSLLNLSFDQHGIGNLVVSRQSKSSLHWFKYWATDEYVVRH